MAFLTIGGTTYEVQPQGAVKLEPVMIGSATRSASGVLRRFFKNAKRQWQFTLAPMTYAEVASLEAAVPLRAVVACSGDAFQGASVDCMVTIREVSYLRSGAASQLRVVQLLLTER